MTSENLYDAALRKAIADYKQRNQMTLSSLRVPAIADDADIQTLMRLEKTLTNLLETAKKVSVPPLQFDAASVIEEYYDKLIKESANSRKRITESASAKKQAREQEHANRVNAVRAHNASLIEPYKRKHEELLQYRSKLEYVFAYYDITPLDINISDTVTKQEFAALIDKSLEVCKQYSVETNSGVFDKIAKPLKGEKNLQFTVSYVAILLVVAYVALPLVAVPIFFKMYKSVDGLYKDIEALRIAYALMTQIDYNRFVDEEQKQTVEDLMTDDIEADMEEELKSVKDYTAEMKAAHAACIRDAERINNMLEEAHTECIHNVDDMRHNIAKSLAIVQKSIKDYMDNYNQFPFACNNSAVFNRKFVTMRVEDRIDIREEIPRKNLMFNSASREKAINAMKLYLANAILATQVKTLVVDIVDPKNMCSDFTEFFSPETKDFIRPNAIPMDKLVQEIKNYTQENIIKLDGKSIDEFNATAEAAEMITLNYRIVILISEYETLIDPSKEGTASFREFLTYSANHGVQVWLLQSITLPGLYVIDDVNLNRPGSVQYMRDIGKKAHSIYSATLDKFRPKALDYISKFGDKYIPRDKWWTFDTIKGIDMHFGLQNGDPSLGYPLVMGDANVHAIMGGATGAGKSAAINQMLISLITKYPPSELQIVFIDFKNVEAAKFTRGYELGEKRWMDPAKQEKLLKEERYFTRLSRIPHLRIISGTTDGEYALSVFDFMMEEMARRQSIINKAGVTKLQNLRENILKEYCNLKGKKCSWYEMRQDWTWYKANVYDVYGDLPRIIVIFDEFQVMYNPEFVENKIISKINGQITAIAKLARAMSCHFWFTSQSMKGTMPADTISNFSMRAALRCTADVSTEILGNPAAGTITQKFGLIYTNCSSGQDKNDNKLWKVPFLDDKPMMDYVDAINDLLESHNERHLLTEFYDEKILVPNSEMDKWYTNHSETFKDPDIFILGERANYSTNKAPLTTTLMADSGENICIAAFDRNDMMNLGLTIINNLKQSEENLLIINSQDKDTYTLMEIDRLCDPRFVELSRPQQDVSQLVDAFEAMIQSRQQQEGPFTPAYIVLIQWERAPYVCVDANWKIQDRFKACLRDGPVVGIHFVFLCKEKGEMPRAIPNACNHHIVGMLTAKDSSNFSNSSKCEKLPDATKKAGLFAMYEYGANESKFRIYQHTFTRTIKSREVVL